MPTMSCTLRARPRWRGPAWAPSRASDVDGFSVIGIENPQIHTRLLLQFPPDQLPVTALWRAFQSGVFALGLEPQTDMTCDEPLAAGEERPYELHIELETV